MKKCRLSFWIFLTVLLFSSCKKTLTAPATVNLSPLLQGIWQSNCSCYYYSQYKFAGDTIYAYDSKFGFQRNGTLVGDTAYLFEYPEAAGAFPIATARLISFSSDSQSIFIGNGQNRSNCQDSTCSDFSFHKVH